MTVIVVWLLKIPGLMFAGGALLIWVAYRLLVPSDKGESTHVSPANSFWGAMKTIIVADALMGLDNVLAVAGAAHGSFVLVVMGLLISIPIVIWGSTLILKWVERFPVIVYIGAGVLALTSAKMMLGEPLIQELPDRQRARFSADDHRSRRWRASGGCVRTIVAFKRKYPTSLRRFRRRRRALRHKARVTAAGIR